MHKLFVANYKMNGDKSFYHSINVLNKIKLKDTLLILCPPFLYLPILRPKHFSLGAQDVCEIERGSFTGEINAEMLVEHNVKYVLVGHSDRRKVGESDEIIAKKVNLAIQYGITPIVCVGEEKFRSNIEDIASQVETVIKSADGEIIFAYEPIWAIGTGKVPTVAKINRAIGMIKSIVGQYNRECKVLYGGSVNTNNYTELMKSDADGFLIGGLSLKIDDFATVLKGVDNA